MFKNMYYSDNVLTAFVESRLLFDLSCTIGNNCGYILYKYGINRSEMCDMAVKGPTEFKVNDATDNTVITPKNNYFFSWLKFKSTK